MAQSVPSADTLLIRISKFISNFFNPFTSLLVYLFYYNLTTFPFKDALWEFVPKILILVVPITLWIYWNVRKGNYSNMDVSNRQERKSLYVFILVCMLVYLLFSYMFQESFDLVMLFLLVLIILMQVSNYFIKSSMHTALNVYTAALFAAVSPPIGILWILIAALVGATRVILKRHTTREVVMGALIAASISFIYLYIVIQHNQ